MTQFPAGPGRTIDWFIPYPFPEGKARPTLAIIREVNLSTSGGTIRARFSQANEKEDVSTTQKLKALFKKIGAGEYNFPKKIGSEPSPQNGDFASPLSLKNDGLHYIIYILRKKSWAFAHNYSPFTVSTEASTDAYFEASHIDPTGNLQQINATGIPAIGYTSGCIAAYFIADRWGTANPNNYADRINIHVDILTRGHYNGQSVPSYIPLIIDPDVRYPGGSG